MITLMVILVTHTYAQLSVGVSLTANIAPPAIPVYTQPPCPAEGYLWTPGYWAYGADGYYWVPGVWVRPPHFGLLWTPGYWGFFGGVYGFHPGYWGPHIGYYGGINYGFGYGGSGFWGGRWVGNSFSYNTAVMNVNTTVVHNTYVNNTVINNNTVNNRTSFNGPGGVNAQPTAEEQRFSSEQHVQPTAEQLNHETNASRNRNQFASVNGGRPNIASMNQVGGQRFNSQGQMHGGPMGGNPNRISNPNQNTSVNAPNRNQNVNAPRNFGGGHPVGGRQGFGGGGGGHFGGGGHHH